MPDRQEKMLDHLYHRTRIDAHITGNIILVAVMAVMALTAGSKFKPFRFGAKWWEPVRLCWIEAEEGWMLERSLIERENYPPAENAGPLQIREIFPISMSVVVVIGVLSIAYFVYACARRQTRLLNQVYAGEGDHPYERPWEEIRVTFWALDAVLVFILFFFLT